MNTLEVFQYGAHDVRTITVSGETWFVLADLCRVLGIANPRNVAARLDEDEKGVRLVDTPGGTQSLTVVNEPGMYQVVLRSEKPEARQFRWWITHEVLPKIRRTGSYGASPALSEDQIVAQALAITSRRVEALEAKVADDAPKVAAYDELMDAEGFYSMEAVAKLGGIGRNTLYARLREAGVIQPGQRMPYQRYMSWFKITTSAWHDDVTGRSGVSSTPRVRNGIRRRRHCPVDGA